MKKIQQKDLNRYGYVGAAFVSYRRHRRHVWIVRLLPIVFVVALVAAFSGFCHAQGTPTREAQRFEQWMTQARRIAPRYGYCIPKDDESWNEWFWLYYFQEGVSPKRAVIDTAKWDAAHNPRYIIYDDFGEVVHQSNTLAGIKRYVRKRDVAYVNLNKTRWATIWFKDGSYLVLTYKSRRERDASLSHWKNLRGIPRNY